MNRRQFFASITGCILYLASFSSLARDQYAVIIGVSDYPNLDRRFNLVGPRNDALLVYEFLQSRGFETAKIQLLTEDHVAATNPTQTNIFNALEQTLTNAKPGDFLYLHFSGHGSQQPSQNDPDEIDGLDETFLPADTKNWSNKTKTVENIITDDHIARFIERFQKKGIFIWLVFDSCHSGTMTRSLWRNRKLTPEQLGVPKSRAVLASRHQAKAEPVIVKNTGGYAAFFAAQTTEETPEINLPRNAANAKSYGLFTYNLIETLTQNPNATYRQVAEQVLQNYAAHPWYGTTPMFIGDGLDQVVFNNIDNENKQFNQWLINRTETALEIPAGYLHSLEVGAILAVMAKPTDDTNKTLGFVQIKNTSSTYSEVTPIDYNHEGQAYPRPQSYPEHVYARLIKSNQKFSLSVALIPNSTLGPAALAKEKKVIDQVATSKLGGIGIDWQPATSTVDVRLFQHDDVIYLLNDSEPLPCPLGPCDTKRGFIKVSMLQSVETIINDLNSKLTKIAKGLNLMRLGTILDGEALASELIVKRALDGKTESFDATIVPTLYEGDELSLYIANYLDKPLDITVLFVGSDYGIDLVFPLDEDFNRFMEEEEKTIFLGKVTTATTGMERLIIISATASAAISPVNYSFLSQSGLPRTRALEGSDLTQLLKIAGFGTADTQAALRTIPIKNSLKSQGSIHTISWITAK